MSSKEALFYKKLDNERVQCYLCPHLCTIDKGNYGLCRVRKNIDGHLYTMNYKKVTSMALDPIEKKPLYRYYPNSNILSVGSFGCNFNCQFCQNFSIAHNQPFCEEIDGERLIKAAISQQNCIGIAYTYNEPSIWYEYVYETAQKAREANLKNVLVTNGFISEEPLKLLLPYIDALNIDVKSFSNNFYKKQCRGNLQVVKNTVEISSKYCHVELTTLIIPELNDNIEEVSKLSKWIAKIDKNIPLHLTRFFPTYNMLDKQPTDVSRLKSLKKEAQKHLNYVYLGNV